MADAADFPDLAETLPLPARDYDILVILLGGPQHGYALAKAVGSRRDPPIRLEPANLYRRLRKLVRAGLVEEVDGDPEDVRNHYSITELGRVALRQEAQRLQALVAEARELDLILES